MLQLLCIVFMICSELYFANTVMPWSTISFLESDKIIDVYLVT